jgi:hypothetical protein
MANPQIILLGSVKEAAKWIGLARKWANQLEASGIVRKVWNLGGATVAVDNYGPGMLRAVIRAVAVTAPPPPPGPRYFDLSCDNYGDAYASGYAETEDIWSLSLIPEGVSLEFYYYVDGATPTRFVVDYEGATVLDTGYVTGDTTPLALLTRSAEENFTVTIYEPTATADAWYYSLYPDCNGGGGGV